MEETIESRSDLTGAVKEALTRRGVYSSIKAKLRAEVFHALQDKTISMPDKPQDVFLATELIRDFLNVLHFDNSSSVFCEESGQPPQMAVDRAFLSNELGFNLTSNEGQASSGVPLLVLLINQLRRIKDQHDVDLMSSMVVNQDE
jgi:lisH domain-containing protein FOPNL